MTYEEAKRIVKAHYPKAFSFVDGYGFWSICNGTKTKHGNIRIEGVSWWPRFEDAWIKAAKQVQQPTPKENQ